MELDGSICLAVGEDGALCFAAACDDGRLAEDDLELPRGAAALRHGLDVGGRGPGERAPVLEVLRRAAARGALGGAVLGRAVAVEVDGAPERRALPAADGLRADHHGHVEAVDERHAVGGLVQVPAVVDGDLHDGGGRRGPRPAAGRGGVAARARGDAAGPEGGREGEGEQRVGAQPRGVGGDGGEARARGHQRPHRVGAEVVDGQRGSRRSADACGEENSDEDEGSGHGLHST
jgi:hypothetical protein|uniref:Uncharacterized protein n=1 Tax=Zea mays TaxID=4577 RepID=A0A804LQQ0_MAIZE